MNKKLLALILVGIVSTASAAVVIDNATKVEMSIKNPIPAEKTAEKELRTYLEKIFGKHTPADVDIRMLAMQAAEMIAHESADYVQRFGEFHGEIFQLFG